MGTLFPLIFRRIAKYKDIIVYFDAIGLGFFSVMGFEKAYTLGVNILGSIMCGLITAIAGGIIRETVVREIPIIFRKEIYATSSLLGLIILYILKKFGAERELSMWISVSVIFFVRIISYRLKLNLPTFKYFD